MVPTARLAEEPREALVIVHNRLKGLYVRGQSSAGGHRRSAILSRAVGFPVAGATRHNRGLGRLCPAQRFLPYTWAGIIPASFFTPRARRCG